MQQRLTLFWRPCRKQRIMLTISTPLCVCVCVCVFIYICVCVWVFVCMCVCVCVRAFLMKKSL